LDRAPTTKYDPRFFNFDDPKIFELMTGDDYKKHWKETYDFDYVSKYRNNYKSELMECAARCMYAEYEQFAQKCRDKGGFFKCCAVSLDLEIFEKTEHTLIDQHLVKRNKTYNCNKKNKYDDCQICGLTLICTTEDQFGKHKLEFTSNLKNEVGGVTVFDTLMDYRLFEDTRIQFPYKRMGLRASFCARLDFCMSYVEYYDLKQFLMAKDKKEFCALKSTPLDQPTRKTEHDFRLKSNDTQYPNGWGPLCPKNSNVRICPSKIMKKQKRYGSQRRYGSYTTNKKLRRLRKKLKSKRQQKKLKSKRLQKKLKSKKRKKN